MQTRRPLSFVLLLIFSTGAAAYGQEKGQVGLTAGYPPAIGVIWHVTDRVAMRPDVTLTRTTREETSPFATAPRRTSWATEVGLAGLFYLNRTGSFSTYVAPRASYSWSRTSTAPSGNAVSSKTRSTGYTVSGSIGGQYAPDTRFSIFGEVGLELDHFDSKSVSVYSSIIRSNTVSTRSAVGVVLYF